MFPEKLTDDIQKRNERFFRNLDPKNFIKKNGNYKLNPFVEYHREKQVRLMVEYLKPSKEDKILVIGIGNGREIEILLNYVEKIYGVDISTKFLKYCKEKFGDRFIGKESNIEREKIIFDSDFFDKVVCFNVLPYFSIKGVYNYFKETSKIIKDNGEMIIKVRNNNFPLANIQERQLINQRLKDNRAIYFNSKIEDYINICKRFNFKIQNLEGGDFYSNLDFKILKLLFNSRWSSQLTNLMELGGKTTLKKYYRHLYITMKKKDIN